MTLVDRYFCQTPVPSPDFSLGLEVDFVLPLSQEEQQEEPNQNIPEGNILEVLKKDKKFLDRNFLNAQKILLDSKLILIPKFLWTKILVGPTKISN